MSGTKEVQINHFEHMIVKTRTKIKYNDYLSTI